MATNGRTGNVGFRCSRCDSTLTFEHGSWQCRDCGHAPNHGAD